MKAIFKEVFAIDRIEGSALFATTEDHLFKIFIDQAIFVHKGLQLDYKKAMALIQNDLAKNLPFNALINGLKITDDTERIQLITGMAIELDTQISPKDLQKCNEITSISDSGKK